MARIRSIHPGLATDEAFMSMTAYAKASWALLWTECDDQGVFEWKPVVLKARILPADNVNFDEILQEYLSLGVVMSFTVGGKQYGTIKNFRKYQRPKKPNKVHPNTPESETFACLTGESSEPVGNQARTGSEKSPQMEDVGGRMKDEGGKKVSPPPVRERETRPAQHEDVGTQEQFEEFWAVYPNPTQRPSAQGNFQFACMKASPATIIAGARAYANKTDDRPWMNPAKWLAEECWNDQPAKPIPKQNRPRPQTRRDEAIEDFLRNDDANENGRQSENDAGGYVLQLPSEFGS